MSHKNINNIIYRLHLFWIPKLIIGGILGPIVFANLCIIPFAIYEAESVGEVITMIIVSIIWVSILIGIGIGIMYLIFSGWKREDHINKIVAKANEYGFYSGDTYLSDIEHDLSGGYDYAKNYLGISNNYIYGIELNNAANSFVPVIIPRNRIIGIAYDISSHHALVAGQGLHITRFLDGGYNVYLDNDKTVVIAYGYKFGIAAGIEAIKKAGYDVGRIGE